jgi:hypothetical protein
MRRLGEWGRGIKAGAGPWVRRVVAMGLGLSALALVTGSLGNLSRALNGALAVGVLLVLALVLSRRPGRIATWRWALSPVIMLASLPIVAQGEALGLLGAALYFFALSLLVSDEAGGTVAALLLTALFFALYQVLAAHWPVLWHAEQRLAVNFSWFVGVGLMLGPTALGLPLLTLFACYALSAFLLAVSWDTDAEYTQPRENRRQKWRAALLFVAWLLSLLLAAGSYIWLQPPLGSWLLTNWPAPVTSSPVPAPIPTLTYLDSLLLLFVLLWLLSALASLGLRPEPLPLVPSHGTGKWVAVGVGLLAIAAVVLTLDPASRGQRGTILFHDTGHLEWGRPVFGRYGPRSGGTFGLWPDYLAIYGYKAQIGPLTAENLEGVQAVVLINLPTKLSAEEKDRLLAFVEAGGGLIIWGEHTGVGRIREPINDLLARLPARPLRLRFDSAVPSRQGWAEGLTLRPHPALYAVQDPIDLVIAVGASLDVEPPAEPIIVGRFGHSDRGDATNQARNYVGDMRYRPGERLGDVVLAAEVQHGQGRIVVVGDTTPLGSVNLMTSMPFHARLLDWVTARRPGGLSSLLGNGWLAALLVVGAGACLILGRSRLAVAGAVLILGLTLALTSYLNATQSAPPMPKGPIAYVDISHQERFDRMLWEEASIGGLNYNLVRNGAIPLLLREIDAEALAGAGLLVIIAPGERFSAREVDAIRRWVEDGGRLLASVGFEESEASEDLLAAFGLALGHIPLGPVEVQREAGMVRFHEAWPVHAPDGQAQTIVDGYGYPLAVYRPWGEGGVLLVGDSSFLLGGTLEDQDSYQEGNILLLRDMLQEYLEIGGGP